MKRKCQISTQLKMTISEPDGALERINMTPLKTRFSQFKKTLYLVILLCFVISCDTKPNEKHQSKSKDNFTINGKFIGDENQDAYLFIVKDTLLSLLDSASIIDHKFHFSGDIPYPHKAMIQIKNHSSAFPFILSKESIDITLNEFEINESVIQNSPINDELAKIKKQSSAIYQKIDYLFPQLQKARMENDYKSLDEINSKIEAIESENLAFITDYIVQNPNKELSGLLLNDLSQASGRDSTQIQNLAKKLAPEIQKTLNFPIN